MAHEDGDGTKIVTLEMLQQEKAKTQKLQDKFVKLCKFEDECLTQLENEEIKRSLKQKLDRIREMQETDEQDILDLEKEIHRHLKLESQFAKLGEFESQVMSMGSDAKGMSQLLTQELVNLFPDAELEAAVNQLSITAAALTEQGATTSSSPSSSSSPTNPFVWDSDWKGDKTVLREVATESPNAPDKSQEAEGQSTK